MRPPLSIIRLAARASYLRAPVSSTLGIASRGLVHIVSSEYNNHRVPPQSSRSHRNGRSPWPHLHKRYEGHVCARSQQCSEACNSHRALPRASGSHRRRLIATAAAPWAAHANAPRAASAPDPTGARKSVPRSRRPRKNCLAWPPPCWRRWTKPPWSIQRTGFSRHRNGHVAPSHPPQVSPSSPGAA